MKLIIIHGPPAVGKLTVATELSKITGYRVVHNHLINDLVESIFEYGSAPYRKLVQALWIQVLKAAASSDVNVIMTFCYAKKSDDVFVRKIVSAVRANKGSARSVLLICNKDSLMKRAVEDSRKAYGKLKNPEKLKAVLVKHEFFSPVSFLRGFTIDNTKMSAKKTAQKIKAKFNL
ncbi:MAG: AAA family ATPase [bacterium]